MKPPTKFELMRANRARGFLDFRTMAVSELDASAFIAENGVRYHQRSAPVTACEGCAFDRGGYCERSDWFIDESERVFGGTCSVNNVIYIKEA